MSLLLLLQNTISQKYVVTTNERESEKGPVPDRFCTFTFPTTKNIAGKEKANDFLPLIFSTVYLHLFDFWYWQDTSHYIFLDKSHLPFGLPRRINPITDPTSLQNSDGIPANESTKRISTIFSLGAN